MRSLSRIVYRFTSVTINTPTCIRNYNVSRDPHKYCLFLQLHVLSSFIRNMLKQVNQAAACINNIMSLIISCYEVGWRCPFSLSVFLSSLHLFLSNEKVCTWSFNFVRYTYRELQETSTECTSTLWSNKSFLFQICVDN